MQTYLFKPQKHRIYDPARLRHAPPGCSTAFELKAPAAVVAKCGPPRQRLPTKARSRCLLAALLAVSGRLQLLWDRC